jgi:hypothetical protein
MAWLTTTREASKYTICRPINCSPGFDCDAGVRAHFDLTKRPIPGQSDECRRPVDRRTRPGRRKRRSSKTRDGAEPPPTARNRFGDVHNAIRSPRQSRDEGTRLKGCGTNRERRRSAPGNAGAHRESADPEPMYTDKRSHRHNGERCASRGSDHLPIRSGQAGTASHVLTARRIDGPPFTPSGKAPASHSTNVI